MSKQTGEYDVVIVGAGAAGLTAAQMLCRQGVRTAVLEARNWIGGRIWTQEPGPFELGAEFIHGRPAALWRRINEAHLVAVDVLDEHSLFYDGKIEQSADFWPSIQKAMDKLSKNRAQDRSGAEFLRRSWMSPKRKKMLTAFIEGFDAARIDEISEKFLAEDAERLTGLEGLYRLSTGYGDLMEWLAGPIKEAETLFLNAPVANIRWSRFSVELETVARAGAVPRKFRARHVIVTVPIGVLKARDIRFSPEVFDDLSDRGRALERLRSGAVCKVVLEFKDRFWEKSAHIPKLGFIHAWDLPFPTWWGSLPLHLPVLTGWAGGPAAEKLAGASAPVLLEHALASLAQIMHQTTDNIHRSLKCFHAHDWLTDPYSRGAYSYPAVGGVKATTALARPVDDTIFFAGEATHTGGMSGTVDGAIATGERAAYEILDALPLAQRVAA